MHLAIFDGNAEHNVQEKRIWRKRYCWPCALSMNDLICQRYATLDSWRSASPPLASLHSAPLQFTPLHSTSLHKTPSNPVIPAEAGIQVRCAPPVVEQNLDSRLRGNDGLNDRKRSELALVFSSRPTKGPSPQPPHRAAMQLPPLHRAKL